MKKIIWTDAKGTLWYFTPAEGERLALSVSDPNGNLVVGTNMPIQVDRLKRPWVPGDGFTAEWAETEDEMIARLLPHVVPQDATGVNVVAPEVVASADHTLRDAWKFANGRIEIDEEKAKRVRVRLIEQESALSRMQRDLAIASFPAEHHLHKKARAAEDAIKALGVRGQ